MKNMARARARTRALEACIVSVFLGRYKAVMYRGFPLLRAAKPTGVQTGLLPVAVFRALFLPNYGVRGSDQSGMQSGRPVGNVYVL